MSKQIGQITFTETDDGYKVEVTGKALKEMCKCGCMPFFGGRAFAVSCCEPDKSGSACCEEDK